MRKPAIILGILGCSSQVVCSPSLLTLFPRCKRCTWWRRQAVSATSWMRDFILDARVIGGGMQSVSERLAERIGENKYFPGNTYVHAQLRQRRRDHQQRAPRPLCHLGGVAELVRLYNLRPRTTPHTAHHAPALIHGTGDRSPCHLPHALLAR